MIFLIGPMGAGKSSVGLALADELHYKFVDLDSYLEAKHGCSIANIFAFYSEDYFRSLESEALAEIINQNTANVIVATGGGIVDRQHNLELIKTNQSSILVVYLRANIDTLISRLENDIERDKRPLFHLLEEKLIARELLYQDIADDIITTDNKSIEQVVASVKTRVQDKIQNISSLFG